MRAFAHLYRELDETTSTNDKVAAMAAYFGGAEPEDAVWALYFLSGRRPKRLVRSADFRTWAAEVAGLPGWLFEESYSVVGDLAETIALLLPEEPDGSPLPLKYWVEQRLLPLDGLAPEVQRSAMVRAWAELDQQQRFVWNKLITSSFRVGVSQRLVVRALSAVCGLEEAVLTHRLMGGWSPTPDFYHRLLSPDTADADKSRPYPFCLAHPIDSPPRELGDLSEWQVEWKWDGIRAQLIRRGGRVFIWSRGEDLVTDRFPEVRDSALLLQDGIVLDGELLAWSGGRVLPFSLLQRRIGRKTLSRSMLRDVPVAFLSFDLLEVDDRDIRDRPLFERRAVLETVLGKCIPGQSIHPAPLVHAPVWEELAVLREESRERLVEGFMLKRLDSPYSVGRKRGVWWKWKVDPFTIDAVLIYAQRGHGKRATLYTDYTFAIRDGDDLVPFAKAYSGLTDEEIRTVDRFIRQNTVERFGPVRSVRPFLVFEIGFEGIRKSSRHRSGVAVRFPRILRWRQDKKPEDADSLDTLNALISRDG